LAETTIIAMGNGFVNFSSSMSFCRRFCVHVKNRHLTIILGSVSS
jgi:hypothetical protein